MLLQYQRSPSRKRVVLRRNRGGVRVPRPSTIILSTRCNAGRLQEMPKQLFGFRESPITSVVEPRFSLDFGDADACSSDAEISRSHLSDIAHLNALAAYNSHTAHLPCCCVFWLTCTHNHVSSRESTEAGTSATGGELGSDPV